MNKILHINLGGYPFTIDEDAYLSLNIYLKRISDHFKNTEGFEEVTADIEDRFAELLLEHLGKRKIIALMDVEKVISILGTPEEFGAESMDEIESAPKRRQLYRDSENMLVAGVCSGLATYGKMSSPTLFRLLFFLMAFLGGLGIIIYGILWAVLPVATSTSERLALRGEPINLKTIGRIFEKQKSDNKAKPFFLFRAIAYIFRGITSIISKIYMIMMKIIRPLLILIGIVLIVALTLAWLASLIGGFYIFPHLDQFLSDDAFDSPVVLTNLLLFVGIPIIALLLFISRLSFRTKVPSSLGLGLFLAWLANLAVLSFSVVTTVKDFSSGYEKKAEYHFEGNELLTFNFNNNPYQDNNFFLLGPQMFTDGENLVNSIVHVHFQRSKDDQFHFYQRIYSRGSQMNDAKINAEKIADLIQVNGNEINLSSHFLIRKGEKFRVQQRQIDIHVPENKTFKIKGNLWNFNPHGELNFDQFHEYNLDEGSLVKLENKDLVCINCGNSKAKEYNLSLKGFDQIEINADLRVYISQKEALDVKLFTDPATKNQIDYSVIDNKLIVSKQTNAKLESAQLHIYLPELNSLLLDTKEEVNIKNFELTELKLESNQGRIKIEHSEIDNFQFDLKGDAFLELNGDFNTINASVKEESGIRMHHPIECGNVKIELLGKTFADLHNMDTLFFQKEDHRSRLHYHSVHKVVDLLELE